MRGDTIGAIVLEDLDFVVDCTELCLMPRDPVIMRTRLPAHSPAPPPPTRQTS